MPTTLAPSNLLVDGLWTPATTTNQRRILRAALGGRGEYKRDFRIGPKDELAGDVLDLREKGLMSPSAFHDYGVMDFIVTEEGIDLLAAYFPFEGAGA